MTDEIVSENEPEKPCPSLSDVNGAVICKRCSTANEVGVDRCARCGSVLAGNRLAVTNAMRAAHLPPDLQHLRAEVAEFLAGCLVDEGDSDLPVRRRAALQNRARLQRRICQIDDALELRGLVDRRGRLRTAWLAQLAALIGTAKALDAMLGLERRAKRVPSLSEVLSGDSHGE
jgi:hypothetical protein